ncbi:MAG: response regulator, partial [Bdellovibrio sp.]
VIEMLATELKEHGIDFLSATDGNTALALIEKEKPSVIVSDYKMPGLNGIELLRFLRNLNITVPVIWITGNADNETMSDAWKLGVFHVFQKPFDPEEVIKEVLKALVVSPDFWLEFKPTFLNEAFMNKHFKRVQIDIEKDLYQEIKQRCLKDSISLNNFINNLLREKVK